MKFNITKKENKIDIRKVPSNFMKKESGCKHEYHLKSKGIYRDGYGEATKIAKYKCRRCGHMKEEKMTYVDNRVYR